MAFGASLQLLNGIGTVHKIGRADRTRGQGTTSCRNLLVGRAGSSLCGLWQDGKVHKPMIFMRCRHSTLTCRASGLPLPLREIPLLKSTTVALTRSYKDIIANPVAIQFAPAIGLLIFALWGLLPLIRNIRNFAIHEGNWKKSRTYYISTSYIQPLLLWTGAMLVCRSLDPILLPTQASQAVKARLLNFVRSLSTVLACAYCLSSLIQQTQKFFVEASIADDTRNMGFQFAGRAVYTGVWIAAFSLFMELLGFSTQKWVTAGGLGTVLLTLAGREIFTNFLSSVMIHATRPFVVNEWIQTKIEGYEVSGTVEHVGWWSPTIVRGDDREAVHIPNHKFTVSVVRNLTQKTHWRIKTHLGISHLDVSKINSIVADMRKVLAKNPMIEQQRLHRRVFLDNIDPENQALLILISCFVKTSHFEEYLCVKEAVLVDLLRVISHHRARLATPIRTVQKIYESPDIGNIPYSGGGIYNRPSNRPFLLIEPQPRINGEDKAKPKQASREEQANKNNGSTDAKPSASSDSIAGNSGKQQQKKSNASDPTTLTPTTASSEGSEPVTTANVGAEKEKLPMSSDAANGPVDSTGPPLKNEPDKVSNQTTSSAARPSFEDNIVLGLALEGSKRTLPIEEGMGTGDDGKLGSPSKDKKGQVPAGPGQDKAE